MTRLAIGAFLVAGLAAGAPPWALGAASVGVSDSTRSTRGESSVDPATWVDHDGRPIRQPPDWEPATYRGYPIREAVINPIAHFFDVPDRLMSLAQMFGAHTRREAIDVNAFDEVPNSTWFTNRNHMRAVPVAQLRQGPDSTELPEKPWHVRSRQRGGTSHGFHIKDARGRHWLVKLDPKGYPQLASGADIVARTLLHAAGYNVPHNEPVRFERTDLIFDPSTDAPDPIRLSKPAELDSILVHGAVLSDGSYSALASLYLPGHVLGSPSMERRRPGDPNDWYLHRNRRELRGLYVLAAWLGNWDTKSTNFLDDFTGDKSSGHVEHYLLDAGSSLGAQSNGPKAPRKGYEMAFDPDAIGRRWITLGFSKDRWREAHQATGIPSVGNFESATFRPSEFEPEVENPAFRALTDRDGYWAAKIVASFSDAQIRAAVDAARYEDPRAGDSIVHQLIERRDRIGRYWFDRMAPLDFFHASGDTLRFTDLAVDLGWSPSRRYDVRITENGITTTRELTGTEVVVGPTGTRASMAVRIHGSHAQAAYVDLSRSREGWRIARVRHGRG